MQLDWSSIYSSTDANGMLKFLNDNLTELMDLVAPVKKIVSKRPPIPWFNNNIKRSIKNVSLFIRLGKNFVG